MNNVEVWSTVWHSPECNLTELLKKFKKHVYTDYTLILLSYSSRDSKMEVYISRPNHHLSTDCGYSQMCSRVSCSCSAQGQIYVRMGSWQFFSMTNQHGIQQVVSWCVSLSRYVIDCLISDKLLHIYMVVVHFDGHFATYDEVVVGIHRTPWPCPRVSTALHCGGR